MHPRTKPHRALVALLVPAVIALGCPPPNPPLAPQAGAPEYQERLLQRVPGGFVHVAGGNLLLERVELALDTRLGTWPMSATYNSADTVWRWSFELSYDGTRLVDANGAAFDTSGLAPGDAIPGSRWVVLDATTLRTKGGRVHVFDGTGRLAEVRFASAPFPSLRTVSGPVAGALRTVAIEQCTAAALCDPVFDMTYDAAGRLVALADRAGRSADFAWDANGRLVQARDGLDVASAAPGDRYEYDAEGRLTARVNSEGERIEYTYAGGRVVGVRAVGPGDPSHAFFHEGRDGTGLYVTRVVDPLGSETRFRYDAERRLHEWIQVDVDAHRTLAWSGVRPVQETLPDGRTTSWTRTGDEVATRTDPSGNVVSFTYAPTAVDRARPDRTPLLRVQDLEGPLVEHTYDVQGRQVASENGAGERTTWTYGPDEMVATATLPDDVALAFSGYGEHGHASSVTTGGQVREWTFDAVGNALRGGAAAHPLPGAMAGLEPEVGGVLERRYDADRNVVAVDTVGVAQGLPTSVGTVQIEWRSDGRERAIRRPDGGDHEFAYDALGRLVERRERVDGTWHSTGFEYDLAGRRTAMQLPNGMRREWSYDAAGCPTARTLLRDGVVEAITAFGYASHRLASVSDPLRGTLEQYFYDGAGRRVLTVHAAGEQTFDTFDLRSRRVSRALLTAQLGLVRQLGWSYDAADRVLALSEDGVPIVSRQYADGAVAAVTTGNGLVRSSTRDPVTGALTATATRDASGALVAETRISRTPFGQLLAGLQLTAATDTHAGVVASTSEHYWVGPQDPGQVIPLSEAGESVFAWEADGAAGNVVFYDHDGLSLLVAAGAPFASNAEGNRLLHASGRDYAWDAAGYAVQRGGESLAWHASGRLAARGGETFAWDALDRLVRWTAAGGERRWGYGGVVEVDAAGAPLALDLGEVRIDLVGDARTYRHNDFRDNVKFTTDDAGAVLAHYRYHPYGVDAVIGSAADPVRFAGGPSLGDGLALLGARVYDADAGRFLSPDPAFQLLNQVGYTFGNPVWFWDPGGTQQQTTSEARTGHAISATAHTTAAVVAVASILVAGPTAPVFYLAALAVAFSVEGLAAAWYTAQALNTSFAGAGTNSPARTGAFVPGGSKSNSGGFAGPTCAPSQIGRVPLGRGAVLGLVGLQLLIALAWARRRYAG